MKKDIIISKLLKALIDNHEGPQCIYHVFSETSLKKNKNG